MTAWDVCLPALRRGDGDDTPPELLLLLVPVLAGEVADGADIGP